jgi:hypothetical protein
MKADDAFRWISFGGLSDDVPGQAGIGGLDISGVKQVMARFTGTKANWLVDGKNTFKLNLAGAKETTVGYLENGRIYRIPCWERNDTKLIALGIQAHLIDVLKKGVSDIGEILHRMGMSGSPTTTVSDRGRISVIGALEAMAADYWVTCSLKRGRPVLNVNTPENGEIIYTDTTGVYE